VRFVAGGITIYHERTENHDDEDPKMSSFMGGSAYTMAREIAEGYIQVSDRTDRNMSPADLQKLSHELDRHQRELRGEPSATDDSAQLQARQRKLLRLRTALMVLNSYRQRTRVKV